MAAALSSVRGFRRGNNANNANLSPLNVNANNAPSNANSNIAFGKYVPIQLKNPCAEIASRRKVGAEPG